MGGPLEAATKSHPALRESQDVHGNERIRTIYYASILRRYPATSLTKR